MAEGNGVDLGSIAALLQRLVEQTNELRRTVATKADLAPLATKAEMAELRQATTAELEQLRQQLRDYHAAVVGHGIHLSEHDERLAHIERRLG